MRVDRGSLLGGARVKEVAREDADQLPRIAAALLVPAQATAGILSPDAYAVPWDSNPSGQDYAIEVYHPSRSGALTTLSNLASRIPIEVDGADTIANCLIGPSGAETRTITATSATAGYYDVPSGEGSLGLWRVICAASGATRDLVVLDQHRKLWLTNDYEDPNVPAVTGCTYDDRMCRIVNDRRDPANKPTDVWYAWGGLGRVPTLAQDSEYWVRQTAWHYLLDVALPPVEKAATGARNIPMYDGSTTVTITSTPSGVLSGTNLSGVGVTYETTLVRLAVARLFADEYGHHYGTTDYDAFTQNEDDYLEALVYWVAELESFSSSDWDTTFSDPDLDGIAESGADLLRARLLVGMAAAYDLTYDALTDDQRRQWREILVRESSGLFNDYIVSGSTYSTDKFADASGSLVPVLTPFVDRRSMLNGHYWDLYGALGIASVVLEQEMSTATSTWGDWHAYVNVAMDDFLAYGDDGAHNNSLYYWSQDTLHLAGYFEAERSVNGSVWDGESWFEYNARFAQHFTQPSGQRVAYGDGRTGDANGPSHLFGLYAETFATGTEASLAQRLAWAGHNQWTSAPSRARRDVFDVLWFDEVPVSPMTDTEWEAEHPHYCAEDRGFASVRTGFDADSLSDPTEDHNTHLAYFGGPLLGGHGDPNSGALWFYGDGHLVTGDQQNTVSKRTLLHSTLVVDGRGQHGDGVDFSEAVPEKHGVTASCSGVAYSNDRNNADFDLFLDNRAATAGGAVDLVSMGTNLRQAYTYETGGTCPDDVTGRLSMTNVNGLSGRGTLDELSRYVVWVEGEAFVYDRMRSTLDQGDSAFRFDWFLQTAQMHDTTGPRDTPVTCAVATSAGKYLHARPGGGGSLYAVFNKNATATVHSGGVGTNLPVSALAEYEPEPSDPSTCAASPVTYPARSTPTTLNAASYAYIEPVNASGALKVEVLDASTSLNWRYTAPDDGSTIAGAHLRRDQTVEDGLFLTSLRKYTQGGTVPAAYTANSGSTQGRAFTFNAGAHKATALFSDPADASMTYPEGSVWDGAGDRVDGRYGIVVHDASGSPFAAQLVRGTLLKLGQQPLVTTTGSIWSVGVNWGSTSDVVRAWGIVSRPADLHRPRPTQLSR